PLFPTVSPRKVAASASSLPTPTATQLVLMTSMPGAVVDSAGACTAAAEIITNVKSVILSVLIGSLHSQNFTGEQSHAHQSRQALLDCLQHRPYFAGLQSLGELESHQLNHLYVNHCKTSSSPV